MTQNGSHDAAMRVSLTAQVQTSVVSVSSREFTLVPSAVRERHIRVDLHL